MDSLRNALGRIVEFLPDLAAGLMIIAIGYLVANVIARLLEPLLHRAGFDRFLFRHGLLGERAPEARAGSHAVAQFSFWVVMVGATMQATRAWRLGGIAAGLAGALAYLPNVVAAAVIFGAALAFGNWVRTQMLGTRAASSVLKDRVGVSSIRAGILTLGTFMALRQLQLAPDIVTMAFTLALGAIAIAAALSFGLGGRRIAERITSDWYAKGKTSTIGETKERGPLPPQTRGESSPPEPVH